MQYDNGVRKAAETLEAQALKRDSEWGKPLSHEVELWEDLDTSIGHLLAYQRGDTKYLRKSDVETIIVLLRNYRREKFGNPITDKERGH